ncbi:MAG: hypothetical protein KDA65_13195 [Planctomycetaceae bacterium]|nr:hypothetical protein [Planctomycetaceae bacterium]
MKIVICQLVATDWVWQPMVSLLHIYAGAGVLIVLALFAYARTIWERPFVSSLLLPMRIAFIAALAILLMGPSMLPPQSEKTIRPKLRILLDTSESMLTEDCEGVSRFQFAQEHVVSTSNLRPLYRDFDVEISGFDEKIRPLGMSRMNQDADEVAVGRNTYLSECVSSAVTSIPQEDIGSLVLLVSDGRDSRDAPIQSAAMLAKSRNVPIYTVALGGQSVQSDVAVLAVPMQDYLLPGEPGAIMVKIYQAGLSGRTSKLRIQNGNKEQEIPIAFNQQRKVELQLPIKQDEPGRYEYKISVAQVDDEVEVNNNEQTVFYDVQKRRVRVLILEGQPFWDSKFLAQSLRKDERIELTQITQLATKKRETIVTRVKEATPGVPNTPEEWAAYDIIILGQAIENVLDEKTAKQLVDFVSDHGGNVIFARGMAYDRATNDGQQVKNILSKIEPVIWDAGELENVTMTLTPSGRTSQWFSTAKMGMDVDQALARLPGFQVTPLIKKEKAATIVLARASAGGSAKLDASGQPAIVRMRYGRGSVVGVLGDGLWQWSLLPPEKHDLVSFYDTFWSNLVRWMAMGSDFQPGQQVAMNLSRTSVRLGDPLIVDVVYKHTPAAGAHPELKLTDPESETRVVALFRVAGREPRFRTELKPDIVGVHRLVVDAPGMQPAQLDSNFNVYDINIERLSTAANPMALQILAEHSGGKFLEADQLSELSEHLLRHRAAVMIPPKLEFIWDQWVIMTLLLLWCGSEWLFRRSAGLL